MGHSAHIRKVLTIKQAFIKFSYTITLVEKVKIIISCLWIEWFLICKKNPISQAKYAPDEVSPVVMQKNLFHVVNVSSLVCYYLPLEKPTI